MDVTAAPVTGTRIVTESISLGEVDAGAFLRRHRGTSRGYWADRRGWTAHAGELLAIRPGRRQGDGGLVDLFAEVAGEARRLEAAQDAGSVDLRFYGGFRFGGAGERDPRWDAFGEATFVLPEREVRVTHGRAVLIGRAVASDGFGSEELSRELAELAEELGERSALIREVASGAPFGAVREGRGVMRQLPSPDERTRFEGTVYRALEAIRAGTLEKVVVARTLEVAVAGGADPVSLVLRLREDDPEAHAFFFEPEPGVAFVGAAPETLFAMGEGRFEATAVAGSTPRGATDAEDDRLAEALLASPKDGEEHAIAVREILGRLEGYVEAVDSDPEPRILRLARIQHLETRITGRLSAGRTALDVVARLHPTPAVGGVPRAAAARFLEEHEALDRGWYAAPVGWFDSEGNGAFAPALRCALVIDGACLLHAGAGVVRGSVPEREWEETEVKLRSVLRALEGSVPG